MKKAEKELYDRMARFGCILCFQLGYGEGTPSEIHHIRRTRSRADSPAIPLCREHHRGDTGIHGMGRKAFERKYETTEEGLLELIQESLGYKWIEVEKGVYLGNRIQ